MILIYRLIDVSIYRFVITYATTYVTTEHQILGSISSVARPGGMRGALESLCVSTQSHWRARIRR